jgi:hypothetical protein
MTTPAGSPQGNQFRPLRVLASLFVLCLSGVPALLGLGEPAQYSSLEAVPLADPAPKAWGAGHQFLQADKDGRIFLLRKDTLDLYGLSVGGRWIPKGRLVKDESFLVKPPVLDAAMSPSGDAWVLFSMPNRLYVFQHGDVETLEAPWLVSAVSIGEGEPLVSVAPGEMSSASPSVLRLKAPPLLQRWDGKRWETLADGRFLGDQPDGVTYGEHMRGEFSTFLASTPERRLWMADEFAYHLRRFSPSGALEDELSVGGGKVVWSERTEEEWAKTEAAARKGGMAGWSRRWLSPMRAETTFRGMTVGRDGALYLLVQTKQGLALDRYQPSLLSLDRVLLKGLEPAPGRLTMAAGMDGLYIAGFAGRDGIWRIDSEDLEKTEWHTVPGAVLNGQPLVPPADGRPQKALKTKNPKQDKTEPSTPAGDHGASNRSLGS